MLYNVLHIRKITADVEDCKSFVSSDAAENYRQEIFESATSFNENGGYRDIDDYNNRSGMALVIVQSELEEDADVPDHQFLLARSINRLGRLKAAKAPPNTIEAEEKLQAELREKLSN